MSGRPRSRSTRSGSAAASASCARRDALHDESLAAQALRERLGDRVLVLDEQELHGPSVPRRPGGRLRRKPQPADGNAGAWMPRAPASRPVGSMPVSSGSTGPTRSWHAIRFRDDSRTGSSGWITLSLPAQRSSKFVPPDVGVSRHGGRADHFQPASRVDALPQEIGAESERQELCRSVLLGSGERYCPDRVPGHHVRGGEQQQSRGEPEASASAGGAAKQQRVGHRERAGDDGHCRPARQPGGLEPVRDGKPGAVRGRVCERHRCAGPVEPEPRRGDQRAGGECGDERAPGYATSGSTFGKEVQRQAAGR